MDSTVSNLLTRHAQAWSDLDDETKLVAKVNYRPFMCIAVLREIVLHIASGTCLIDGEFHHMKIERQDDYNDTIWYWK